MANIQIPAKLLMFSFIVDTDQKCPKFILLSGIMQTDVEGVIMVQVLNLKNDGGHSM